MAKRGARKFKVWRDETIWHNHWDSETQPKLVGEGEIKISHGYEGHDGLRWNYFVRSGKVSASGEVPFATPSNAKRGLIAAMANLGLRVEFEEGE
jgi:hypothetical protein